MQDLPVSEQSSLLQEGAAALESITDLLQEWRLQQLLGGPYDRGGAVVSIQVHALHSV